MRKLFLAMAAVAALLASCSKDDAVIDTPTEGAETTVTFDISTPELATRYGEGNNATTLEWYVYEFDGSNYKNVAGLNGTKTFQKQTTVGIKFLMGRKYHVLFWAHADGAPYKVDPSDATMTVDYAQMEANNEDYDAFYKFHEVGLVTTATQGGTVELTRPFAQLNIATADSEDAEKAGYALDKTGIEVKVYSTMNFKTGNVGGHEVRTFTPAAKATGEITVSGTKYDIISMNYLLVNQKETPDVTLFLQEANNNKETLERVYTTVPVQRNHRTYILGNVFTKPAEFNVIIKEGFLDDQLEKWDGATYEKIEAGADGYYSVSHAAELAYIFRDVDKSKNDVKIRLEADINFGGHTIPAWSGDNNINGYKVVLEGNGNRIFNFKSAAVGTRATADYQIAGLFDIACGAEISNLTIENATIDAGNSAESYAGALIGKVSADVAKLTNVTVLNSSVTGTQKVGGLVGFATADGTCLEIENCHVIDTDVTTHSVAKESGSAGGFIGCIMNSATISNSSVEGGTLSFIMENPEETPNVFAKRANSKFIGVVGNGTVELTNCSVDVDNYTNDTTDCAGYVSPYGELVGGNRGTATVVIDGVEYVASAGNITAYVDVDNAIEVVTLFEVAAKNGVNLDITLTNDITLPSDNMDDNNSAALVVDTKNVTINLNNKTLKAGNSDRQKMIYVAEDASVTIKNGKLEIISTNGVVDGTNTSTGGSSAVYSDGGDVTMENVEIIGSKRGGHRAIEVYNATGSFTNVTIDVDYGLGINAGEGSEVTLTNCNITVNGMYSAPYNSTCFSVMGGGSMTVESGNYKLVNDSVYNTGNTHGGWVGIIMSSGGNLTLNGGTFTNIPTTGFMPQYERPLFSCDAVAGQTATLNFVGGTYDPQEDQIVHKGGSGGTEVVQFKGVAIDGYSVNDPLLQKMTNNGDGTWTIE